MFVKSSIGNPDMRLLKEYFKMYAYNNLIKSQTISQVLELKQKIVNGYAGLEEKISEKNKRTDHLKAFDAKTFYLYSYRQSQDENVHKSGVARAVLTFQNNGQLVELITYADNTYLGTAEFISNNSLVLRLEPSNTRERSLTIHFHARSALSFSKYKYMVGTYVSFSGRGAPIAGVVIGELTSDKRPVACEIFTHSEEYKHLSRHVQKFFRHKKNNEIATRAKGIFSDADFDEFFAQQKNKVKIPARFEKVFIAYPISSSVTDFGDLNPLMVEIKQMIQSQYNCKVFYAGETNSGLGQSYLAAQIDFKELNECDLFILIHPRSIASSTLVEAGWAIGQGKTTLIFFKDRKDLPFILRDIKHVGTVNYFDFDGIEQLSSVIKNALDWLVNLESQ